MLRGGFSPSLCLSQLPNDPQSQIGPFFRKETADLYESLEKSMNKLFFLFFVIFLSACASFQVGGDIQKGKGFLTKSSQKLGKVHDRAKMR